MKYIKKEMLLDIALVLVVGIIINNLGINDIKLEFLSLFLAFAILEIIKLIYKKISCNK